MTNENEFKEVNPLGSLLEKPKSRDGFSKKSHKGRFIAVDEKADKFMKFYMTQTEYDYIKQCVTNSGLKISQYCLKRIIGHKVRANIDNSNFHELSKLGGILNKLGGLQKELFKNSEQGKTHAKKLA